ncbi:AN1-type zinc finger protein 5-like [Grus japonensis]|uniref:AN1-type zinc finger protein 5-like n=1 Tax=Grus japonensis TaxID=30415 RepID=A0ABC9VXG6_GRUJA
MLASSKMDPPLDKAEPISNGGSTSGRTSLRRGKKTHQEQFSARESSKRNNSADTQVNEEGGGGGAPGAKAEIPLQPMEKAMVRQVVSLQPMEVNGGADIHLQPLEDPTPEQVDAPKGGCDPMESPHWRRLQARPVAPWREEPTPEQVFWHSL